MRTIHRAALACSFAICATTAAAEPAPQLSANAHDSIHVRYSDLDLSSPAGVRRLNARVKWAASSICYRDEQVIVSNQFSVRNCVSATVGAARPQVNRVLAQRSAPIASAVAIIAVGR